MSQVCPNASSSLTDTDLSAVYGDNINPGLLPSSPYSNNQRDSSGMLLDATLKTAINNLKSQGLIPATNLKGLKMDKYMEQQQKFINNIQSEYCFYDSRYRYALQRLLSAIQEGYANNIPDIKNLIDSYLSHTQRLNQRLNDLTQLINGITDDVMKGTSDLNTELMALNKVIKERETKLKAQNDILSSAEATTILNKNMVKFTEEKAKYNNNLLKLYSFLNVVALGLLVYVYKSAN